MMSSRALISLLVWLYWGGSAYPAQAQVVAVEPACLDDAQLQRLQTQLERSALLYVWSPRMVYSVTQMELARQAALRHGLDFVVLHDMSVPMRDIEEAWAAARSIGAATPLEVSARDTDTVHKDNLAAPPQLALTLQSRALCSSQLLAKDATRHFPTAFVLTSQGLHRFPIVGAMPPSAWAQSIELRLTQP